MEHGEKAREITLLCGHYGTGVMPLTSEKVKVSPVACADCITLALAAAAAVHAEWLAQRQAFIAERDALRKLLEELKRGGQVKDPEINCTRYGCRASRIKALGADLSRVREQNQRLQDTLALHTGPRVTMTVSYASELENARDENIRLHSEAREAARRVEALLPTEEDLAKELYEQSVTKHLIGAWKKQTDPRHRRRYLRLAQIALSSVRAALAAPDPREPRQ